MNASQIFDVTVDRLCRIRSGTVGDEDPFPLDEDRFLDPSAARVPETDTARPGALVPPRVAFQEGALVLLGEPGAGKSTVLRGLMAELGEKAVYVDGAELSDELFEDLVGRHLDGTPCVLVLDQVDESPMVRRLAARLGSAWA
jgi:type II secretory pathway predicted ATPase ExeA